jgi:FMN phosphatase YigB (HAD superfamily)
MAPPRFFYFDLGNVLVRFSTERMYRQMAQVSAGVAAERIREVVVEDGLLRQYELGHVSDEQFYETFCRRTGTRPDLDALMRAGSDIFELNASILPVVGHLQQAGYRLGVLSNTCRPHWAHVAARFPVLAEAFPVRALSFEIGAAKPDAAIFRAAAELAGTAPEEIFFTDDAPEHVAGAKAAGIDAVPYTSTSRLAEELRRRGVRFNY